MDQVGCRYPEKPNLARYMCPDAHHCLVHKFRTSNIKQHMNFDFSPLRCQVVLLNILKYVKLLHIVTPLNGVGMAMDFRKPFLAHLQGHCERLGVELDAGGNHFLLQRVVEIMPSICFFNGDATLRI